MIFFFIVLLWREAFRRSMDLIFFLWIKIGVVYPVCLARTSPQICRSGLEDFALFASSLSVAQVVVTSSTMSKVAFWGSKLIAEGRKTNAAFRFFNLSDLVSFTWEVVAFTFLKQGTRGISSWVASSFARSSDWLYPFWKYLRYRCEGTKEIKSWSFCIARVRSGLSCVNKAHLSAKNPAISLLWWNLSLRMSFLRSVL